MAIANTVGGVFAATVAWIALGWVVGLIVRVLMALGIRSTWVLERRFARTGTILRPRRTPGDQRSQLQHPEPPALSATTPSTIPD